MVTSGTNTFTLNRNQIIEEAYKLIGVMTPGRALTNQEIQDAVTLFNLMIKAWKAKGQYIWKTVNSAVLFPVSGQINYVIDGVSSNVANWTDLATPTLAADANSGATSISVSSASGMVTGYIIGIVTDNNTIFWTTIASISGTTITLTDALDTDCSADNNVFAYETNINFPQAIVSAAWRNFTNSTSYTDIPIAELSQEEYQNLSQKLTSGNQNQFYYDKQRTYGTIYLWPAPNSVNFLFQFIYEEMFEDVGSATDNPDFPVEWLETLIYGLAWRLGVQNGIGQERLSNIKQIADDMFEELKGYDRERYTSIFFQPNFY